jgi:DNA polymerase I-like protein with 3'-5' exonuclease and polymerase domains
MIVRDEIERVLWQELGLSESALRSPNQLKKILFEERGMHRGFEKQLERSDKTNDFATNEGNLEILATKYEACELICAFRSIDKIISTYLTPALAHSQDFGQYNDTYFLTSNTSRTSAKFSQLMPRSGSLSEKIKFNKKLRDALSEFNVREIVAGKKHPDNPDLDEVILAVDISSNEYRWAALASEDEQMIKMYRAYSCQRCGETGESNIAMHCCPKCGAKDTEKMPTGEKTFLHGDDLHAFVRDVTNEFLLKIGKNPIDRSRAKNVSFCVVFNGSAGKLVEMLGVTWDQGNAIKEAVFERCPNLRQWQQNTEKIAEGSGEVRSILSGRRRKADYRQRIKDIAKSRRIKGDPPLTDKDKQWIKKNVVNELVNFQCQAPGTKLCMLAMEKCYKAILDKGWWDKVKIISFVHDEVVFKLPRHLAEEAKEVFVNCFETAITARLPFLADGNFGPSYADAK